MLKKFFMFTALLSSIFLFSHTIAFAANDKETPNGRPFQDLRAQIHELIGDVDGLDARLDAAEAALTELQTRVANNEGDIDELYDLISALESEIASIQAQLSHNGKQVAPGLYEVHTRVLWSIGMLTDHGTIPSGYFEYNEHPKNLIYGPSNTLFLSPLRGYGIPDPAPGSTRKVRLYVNYGHQWMCLGTPTITIGDVEFELPMISGHWAAMGAHWSNFRDYSEYAHVGHAGITIHLKDFVYGGGHCGPYPGTNRVKGAMYRVEAHYYDDFNS